MSLALFLVQALNGLELGVLLFLIAAGLTLVFGVMNFINLAHGVAGFKRSYSGEMVDELYVPLNQLDFSAELTRIAVEQPTAVFAFLPGGVGVNFIKQFSQAGLNGKVKVLSVFTADEVTLPAQRDAAIGVFAGTHWTPDLDNARNKAFVAAYERHTMRCPRPLPRTDMTPSC